MKKNLFTDLLNLIYPDLCLVCNESLLKHENQVCLSCLNAMPKTNFHLQANNPVERRFWGKVIVAGGTSFFFFQKGSPFQKLLHGLKYKGNKEVGELMGKYAASDLLESPAFTDIDIIVPVPLHPKKYAKRGYNQSEWIGRGLSQILGKPQDTTNLVRVQENMTQTRKSVFERYENTEGIFKLLDNKLFEGKHILLVDDVLTTGSTLEACIKVLQASNGIKISIFTLAIA